jgi:hypothetical protein
MGGKINRSEVVVGAGLPFGRPQSVRIIFANLTGDGSVAASQR